MSAPCQILAVLSAAMTRPSRSAIAHALLIGVWQQDRWANGSARGIVAGMSFDGGVTWQRQPMPFHVAAAEHR